METLRYEENTPVAPTEIAALRRSVGWNGMRASYENPKMISYCHIACYDAVTLVGYLDTVSNGVTDAYLQDLMVRPDYQGRGVGTHLVAAAIEKLRKDGIYMISVAFEEKLLPFYRRFGFQQMMCGQLQTREEE